MDRHLGDKVHRISKRDNRDKRLFLFTNQNLVKSKLKGRMKLLFKNSFQRINRKRHNAYLRSLWFSKKNVKTCTHAKTYK